MERKDLTKAVLAYQASQDESLATEIIRELDPLVVSTCRKFYMDGMETADVLQEGRIGLFKAMRDYRAGFGTTFVSFAVHCIRCQCISAVKAANRCKQQVLTQALSLNVVLYAGNERISWMDTIVDEAVRAPGEELLVAEDIERCSNLLREILSPYHFRVLEARLAGGSYLSIANELGRKPKSIDNALQRAKKLIYEYFAEHEDLNMRTLEHYFAYRANQSMEDAEASAIA